MFFEHVFEKGLAQSSYIVGCQASGDAVVIDPRRDIDVYLAIAEREGLRITYVTETHIHADFLSGARELAAATGAEILLSAEGGPDWTYEFPHRPLRDDDVFWVGKLKFQVLHTPGHTPEHISFLLTDTAAGSHPVMLFTGDFVFVGDVGRPDLLEEAAGIAHTKEPGARQMYRSLQRFRALPDFVQVWPGHGAGSACGKALGAVPSSTVGYEKLTNWALQVEDEDAFVAELLTGQPEPPRYFGVMKKLNRVGPAVLGGIPHPARLTLSRFRSLLADGVTLVDTRDKFAFAGGHIPGSLNIQADEAFSTWAGWMLDYERPFMLVAADQKIDELSRALIRIGLDQAIGYIPDVTLWAAMGNELQALPQITADELYERWLSGRVTILDVRTRNEYEEVHIPGAMQIHAGHLVERLQHIPTDKPLVVHCLGGDRSSLAASLLQSQGFDNVLNLTGGIRCWLEAGYPVERNTMEEAVA
ncbi:MAG: MBL fold metallo-hydrolase [Chloroflexi bacterium]|nr:MAG: MBL fold metallo-hydrolase [Chloroflexota bacterium]